MSGVFWEELGIPPYSINLDCGSGNQGAQTARIMEKLENYLLGLESLPRCVLLYGDTNSTLAGSVVASKMQIPVIHIEAGLRSFNREMPEEINRIVTDHLSDLLFCSSEQGAAHLLSEGISKGVYISGDVMYDAILSFTKIAEFKYSIQEILPFEPGAYGLLTLHRPSNTDNIDNMKNILDALASFSCPIVWPVHPRMNGKFNGIKLPANVHTVPPYSYLEMLTVLKAATKVFTDSGGVQKEAYWLKKPCITLREETEWVETLHHNWNIICGANSAAIKAAFKTSPDLETWIPLYGDGNASGKIASIIKSTYYN